MTNRPVFSNRRETWWVAICALSLASGCGGPQRPPALEPTRIPAGSARQALRVAEAAASAWMRDSQLIYLENDSTPEAEGGAVAWGFLFHSELADSWRNVAVREGQVVHEGPLSFPFPGPELPATWIDSGDAVRVAEQSGGREFRQRTGAALRHVALGRGIFTDWSGPPTWTVVYRAPDRGELAIVVNATDGTVLQRFEG